MHRMRRSVPGDADLGVARQDPRGLAHPDRPHARAAGRTKFQPDRCGAACHPIKGDIARHPGVPAFGRALADDDPCGVGGVDSHHRPGPARLGGPTMQSFESAGVPPSMPFDCRPLGSDDPMAARQRAVPMICCGFTAPDPRPSPGVRKRHWQGIGRSWRPQARATRSPPRVECAPISPTLARAR